MKIAQDPTPFHHDHALLDFPRVVADLGYEHIQLTPHADLIPFFRHPKADDALVRSLKKACDDAGVGIASLLPVQRWSGPGRVGPRGRGAQLEADHPDRGRPRRQGHRHRVLRPSRARRGVRGRVLPLDGGAPPDHRARGHRPAHRPAPRRLRRGRPRGGPRHPRAEQPQRRHGLRRLPHLPHGPPDARRSCAPARTSSAWCTSPTRWTTTPRTACATSRTRPATPRACTSTCASAPATSTGTTSSAAWPRSASTTTPTRSCATRSSPRTRTPPTWPATSSRRCVSASPAHTTGGTA